jgi:glycosyltransferase involved in cell wall biosynthesis
MAGVKYIGPVFDGCYDADTEVLTADGWKFFSDLSFGDFLATINSGGALEYHKPNQLIVKDWDGEMCHFYNHRAGIDLLVTPDHNMYVAPEIFRRKSRKSSGFRFEKANQILDKYRLFKKNCSNPVQGVPFVEICDRQIRTEDWLEFLGYYLSEGSATITKEKHYIVQLRQFGENLYKMASALQKVSPGKVNVCTKDGRAIINDKALATFLKQTFGNKYEKFIPRNLLNSCSSAQLKVLLRALMLGDGHAPEGGGSTYTTASVKLRDDFMELLLKTGLSGSYVKRKEKGEEIRVYNRIHYCKADNWDISVRWKQQVCAVDGVGWDNGSATKNKKAHYKGKVYCASVPNHTLFVRRNGKAVWCGNSGYAEAARNYVLAIHKAGYPITLSPISFEATRPELGEDGPLLYSLINKPVPYDKVITHCTPDLWANALREESYSSYKIGYTVWETSKLHPAWVEAGNGVNEIWLPCDWNMEVFKESGISVPLLKIPHALEIPDLSSVPDYNIPGVTDNTYVFYSIFQWQERKNPYGLLCAYSAAFSGVEDVILVLKTYYRDQSKDADQIRSLVLDFRKFLNLPNYPKMFLVVENLSSEAMASLHKRGDCFVLLQRSEGWGLPHFEAASCGNPVITPAYGGQTEFLNPNNSYLLDYTLTPVGGMSWSPYYLGDQFWCEPDMKQAIETMQHVYVNREEAASKGQLAQAFIKDNFTWDKIGEKIVKRLTELDGRNV